MVGAGATVTPCPRAFFLLRSLTRLLIYLATAFVPAGARYAAVDAELQEPAVLASSGGSLAATLALDEWSYEGPDGLTLRSRAFDGGLPGPTLRIRRGDSVVVRMENRLADCTHPGQFNTLRDPCVTNLHTHGLHVGSEPPEDDVFVEISPGHSHTYTYSIPPDHLGGTHWYHPHHHGSTALHVGGGASGALIVEDEESDGLPAAYRDMPEKVIVLTVIHTTVAQHEAQSGGSWITAAPPEPLLLLNGMTRPRITWAANTWLRLRLIFSAVQHYLELSVPSGCEAVLLAKDGVWLPGGARSITTMAFASGNRNDVAVRCLPGGPYALTSGGAGRRLQQGPGGGGGGQAMLEFPAQSIASFYATDTGATAAALPALTVKFPGYLSSLLSVAADEIFGPGIDLGGGGGDCAFACGPFDPSVRLHRMSLGEVQEMAVEADEHPFHMHVNHMQITESNQALLAGWHQVGDWVDTYLGIGTVRFRTDRYTGKVVLHCHLLQHEDEGCMTLMEIMDEKPADLWGYCFNAPFAPLPAGLACAVAPALLCLLLLALLSGGCRRACGVAPRCRRCGCWSFVESRNFAMGATAFQLCLLVVAVLPLVNDGAGGIVEQFHRNEDDYKTMLAIAVPCFLISLLCLLVSSFLLRRKIAQVQLVPTSEPMSEKKDPSGAGVTIYGNE